MAKRWSPSEDAVLRDEVRSCDEATTPVSWANIAERLPGRSNKDCRKRWAKIDGRWHHGAWSESEDTKLRAAVACHGPRWTLVSEEVGTRNPDQCHKRWRNALSLDLDRSMWTPKDDDCLLKAVTLHGRNWSPISQKYFPNRSPLELSNRFSSLSERSQSQSQSVGESARACRQDNHPLDTGIQGASKRSRHVASNSNTSALDFQLNRSGQQSHDRDGHGRARSRFTLSRGEVEDDEADPTTLGQMSPPSSEATTQGSSRGMLSGRLTVTTPDDTQMLNGSGYDVLKPAWPGQMTEPGFAGDDDPSTLQLNWLQGIEEAAAIPLEAGLDVSSFLHDLPAHSGAGNAFHRLSAELGLDGSMGNAFSGFSPNSDGDVSGYMSQLSPSEMETTLSTQCPTEAMSATTSQLDIPLIRVGRGDRNRSGGVEDVVASRSNDRGVTLVLENVDRATYNTILGVLYDRGGGGSSVRVVMNDNP